MFCIPEFICVSVCIYGYEFQVKITILEYKWKISLFRLEFAPPTGKLQKITVVDL